MKTIYELNEHESMIVEIKIVNGNGTKNNPAYPYVWQVTRVATGWLYQDTNPNIKEHVGFFVPLTTYQNTTI